MVSLQEAVRLSLQSSHVLEEARAVTSESRAATEEAWAPARPRIGLEANGYYLTPVPVAQLGANSFPINEEWNYRTTAFLKQTVADFGRTHYRVQASLLGQEASEAAEEEAERMVALATARAYLQVLATGAQLQISEDEVVARRELLKNSEAKVREGAAARYDLVRSEAELAGAEVRQTGRVNEYKKSLALLWSLTGTRFAPEPLGFSPLPPQDEAEALEAAQSRPELVQLRALIAQQENLAGLEAADARPRLSFQTEYSRQNPVGFQLNQQWRTGLLLEIPLYDGGKARARADQKEAKVTQFQARLAEAERQVALEVENAYLDFVLKADELVPAQRRLEQAAEAHRLSQLRYQVGLSTLSELLETRSDLTVARSGLETARYSLHLAWVEWLASTGRLDPEIDTPLGKVALP